MNKDMKNLIKQLHKIEQEEIILSQPSTKLKEDMTIEELNREIKNVQSIKSRLKKKKELKGYNAQMTKVLQKEQLLKEIKSFFTPTKIPTTTYTQEHIDKLTQEETLKALKSIQSKKSNTRYLKDQSEYESAVRIEKMLQTHRDKLNKKDTLSKIKVEELMETIKGYDEVNKEQLLKMIEDMKK